MTSAKIQSRIKKGLAKAVKKTGSSSSELVYLVQRTNTGGNSPINPPNYTETKVLLVDAIFKTFDATLVDGDIKAGDRELVSNSDVKISQGDIIEQGSVRYVVINVDVKAPTSDVLVYTSQVRIQ